MLLIWKYIVDTLHLTPFVTEYNNSAEIRAIFNKISTWFFIIEEIVIGHNDTNKNLKT